jgi:hypothetical protein
MNSATTQTSPNTGILVASAPLTRGSAGATAFLRPRHGARRGQTIVIALLVLLLLAFLGGLFATIVTHNLANAARSNRVQTADYYAEAGIRFANDQLTDSLDGADWRPPLQAQLGDGTNNTPNVLPRDTYALARYNAIKGTLRTFATVANDPDRDYLIQGFTRYNIGGGRYLLRVTYDPIGLNNQDNTSTTNPYTDPRARYIKIESVGREGAVDPNDPTTYTNVPRTQLNATLVQYKAIGITDYARFETNPDNRSDVMPLGVASQYDPNAKELVTPGVFDFDFAAGGVTGLEQYAIPTVYGASNAYISTGGQFLPDPNAGGTDAAGVTSVAGGGSIHVNGSVRFFGENVLYLSNNATNSGTFGDTAEVAGSLLLDNYTPGPAATELTTGQDAQLIVNPPTTGTAPATDYVAPTNDTNGFNTLGGKVRDGNSGTDVTGQPRNVNRLEPPTLDTVNPVTNLPRYASIAKNATPRVTENTASGTPATYAANSAAYGYGQSIYIDNSTDVQHESTSIVGGYTLVDEWLHRAGADSATGGKGGWVANFYRPPGVDIVIGRQTAGFTANNNPVSFYGIRMTRSDTDGAGSLIGWKNPDGTTISGVNGDGNTQSTMTVSYKSLNASNDLTAAANPANPNNDVIIYAEGNVRVHGVVSAVSGDTATTYGATDDQLPRHITIVTDGTAYIDGSILRGNEQSSVTVLAHDYVCVNTTQFLAGPIVDENPYGTTPPGAFVGDLSLRALDFGASDELLIQELSLVPASGQNPHLYISGGPGAAGNVAADFDLLDSRTGGNLTNTANAPFTNLSPYLPGAPQPTPFFGLFSSAGAGQPSIFRTTFDLGTVLNNLPESEVVDLAIRRDQGGDAILGGLDTQDFVLERAAVLPMNIRIEATLFAQTRSFFVIPGEWFNTDTTDTLNNYVANNPRPNMLGQVQNATDVQDKDRFPFFGQPIDMKVTIDGSVSEARPADISAQSAWMTKWGWIPQYRGGLNGNNGMTTETTGRTEFNTTNPLGIGLQIVYNPLAGFPYDGGHYLRTDLYGRPLPYAPKLPVCTGLLYAGQNDSESVLQ